MCLQVGYFIKGSPLSAGDSSVTSALRDLWKAPSNLNRGLFLIIGKGSDGGDAAKL
jgi:hypothetical protein